MDGLTETQAKVMDFLLRNFSERNSINEVARRLNIRANSASWVLNELKKKMAVIPEKISNSICYRANLHDEASNKLAAYILSQNALNGYSKAWADDLEQLKDKSLSVVLFGSILSKGRDAQDVDVLIVLEKKNLKKVKDKLKEIGGLRPKRVHPVFQTKEDLTKNIRKKDEVILEIIRSGRILWGSDIIVEAIRNGASGQ